MRSAHRASIRSDIEDRNPAAGHTRVDGDRSPGDPDMTAQSTLLTRGFAALVQGAGLYFLYYALETGSWPSKDAPVLAPLVAVALFVPAIVVAGAGTLRSRTLAVWAVVATVLVAGLSIHDVLRDPPAASAGGLLATQHFWAALATTVILFILHALIVSGDIERSWRASYPRLFDVTWKHGIQLALAAGFVGAFWALLFLGAQLFQLIDVTFVGELIASPWFAIPATTAFFACAIHATDVRAEIVRGTRTLGLTLLAWLLPIMTLIAGAFLFTLPFTGLEPLWSTRNATVILLAAAAALVVLINAAYQDGGLERPAAAVLRMASALAVIALAPIVGLAAYALALRVAQHGWTPDRIFALAAIVAAACYALGYLLALVRSGPALRGLESANLATAMMTVVVLLSLFTPIADPARISVADQVARLESDVTSPGNFDYHFLRFNSGRYGIRALETLAARTDGPMGGWIAERAREILRQQSRYARGTAEVVVTARERATNVTVRYPRDGILPQSFLDQDWNQTGSARLPRCLTAITTCAAILTDLDGDGAPEILLIGDGPSLASSAFKSAGDGRWREIGPILNAQCIGVRSGLWSGRVETVVPALREVVIGGQRLRIDEGCAPGP
jgi:hypothetical protein